jgi:hypothetical protein
MVTAYPDRAMATSQRTGTRHGRHIVRSAIVALTLAATTASCFTGERPSFGCGAGESTGRTEIDDVLNRLECVATSTFTADYAILTRLGGINSAAKVVQASSGRRSITINDVRYVYDNGRTVTCDLITETCEAIINEARTSDVLLTSEFYAQAMATRLRVDADRRIGDPVASELELGGQPALCVAVPVTGGTKTYCALESGALARFDGSDLLIELTGYSVTPDEASFET